MGLFKDIEKSFKRLTEGVDDVSDKEAKSKFKIKPEDYNVIIPNLVKDQIAKEIEITVDVILSPVAK